MERVRDSALDLRRRNDFSVNTDRQGICTAHKPTKFVAAEAIKRALGSVDVLGVDGRTNIYKYVNYEREDDRGCEHQKRPCKSGQGRESALLTIGASNRRRKPGDRGVDV